MARIRSTAQLPLELSSAPAYRREDFLEGPGNTAALALIDSFPEWPAPVVCLVGPEGSGKTHLGAIFADQADARRVRAADLGTAFLPEIVATGAACVEDLAPGAFDEAALFHLLNLVRETGAKLLLTARTMPSHWPLAVADLASRLKAAPVVSLAPADDPLLAAVLLKLFADRQIAVDGPTVHYLLARMERSVAGAQELVRCIDAAALAARRPVTRAFVAELMRGIAETPDPETPDSEAPDPEI